MPSEPGKREKRDKIRVGETGKREREREMRETREMREMRERAVSKAATVTLSLPFIIFNMIEPVPSPVNMGKFLFNVVVSFSYL